MRVALRPAFPASKGASGWLPRQLCMGPLRSRGVEALASTTAAFRTLPANSAAADQFLFTQSNAANARRYASTVGPGRSNEAHEPVATTLFGAGLFKKPGDFTVAANSAIEVCNTLLAPVEAFAQEMASPSAKQLSVDVLRDKALACLQQLDAISNTLCMVLDAAEACRNVHGDSRWREAAEECFASLGGFMYALNAHYPLFAALSSITSNGAIMAALTPEQRRMAVMLRREFEKDGIHLPDDKRQRLVKLNSEMHALAGQFSQGAVNCLGHGHAEVSLESFPSLLKSPTTVLPPSMVSAVTIFDKKTKTRVSAAEAQRRVDSANGGSLAVHIPLGGGIAEHILKHCPDVQVRKAVLTEQLKAPKPNLPALHALRDKRHEIASDWVGFPSYAHMVAYDRLSGSPLNAVDFLQRLSAAILPKALEELAWVAEAKAAEANGLPLPLRLSHAGGGDDGESGRTLEQRAEDACVRYVNACALGAVKVNPWDVQYFTQRILQGRFTEATAASPSTSSSAATASTHHSLSSVLYGMQQVCERVFGIRAELCSVTAEEAWDGGKGYDIGSAGSTGAAPVSQPSFLSRFSSGSSASSSATSVLKLRLSHPVDGDLGTIYLDLFPRPSKFNGAAHFVVRSSKRLHSFDGGLQSTLGVTTNAPSAEFQTPIVVLATNFFAGESAPTAGSADHEKCPLQLPPHLASARLSPSETITFWHEFGHALHSLLYRGQFQHLAGTRTALDFVEVPSHTSEYWARDARVAQAWCPQAVASSPAAFEHYHVTGQHVSPKYLFAALQLQGDIVASLFDLAFHGDTSVIESVVNPLSANAEASGLPPSSSSSSAGNAAVDDAHLRVPPMENVLQSLHKAADAWGKQLEQRGGDRAVTLQDICVLGGDESGSTTTADAADAGKLHEQRRQDRAAILKLIESQGLLRPADELCVLKRPDQLTFRLGDPIAELDGSSTSEGSANADGSRQQQRVVGSNEGSPGSTTSSSAFRRAWHRDSSALLAAVQAQYSLTPVVEGSAWQGGFSHLVTYGGGYYAYSYAAAFSAGLWRTLFANDPWSREAGDKYRAMMLGRGGSDDPAEMLEKVLGRYTAAQTSNEAASRPKRTASLAPLLQTMGVLK